MPVLSSKSGSIAAAAVALALLPGVAAAAPVPPENPAATQYTEAFPTAGGQQDAEGGKGRKDRQPSEVLGKENAQRLESQGAAGEAAAALAAETAPAGAEIGAGVGGGGGSQQAGNGNGGSGQDASSDSGGGSRLGEVASQATGSSFSQGTDLLLPLVILGSFIWLLAYLLRRRQRPAE